MAKATKTSSDTLPDSVLLDDLRRHITKYVSMSTVEADAVTLWVAHTHALAAADATPYLHVSSVGPESGKTRLLEVLAMLTPRPWMTGRVTGPALQRRVDAECPTLLLDEVDTLFHGTSARAAEYQRGMINTGYLRSGSTTVAEGSNSANGYKEFKTWCPKVLAGIGDLPHTIMSRSIRIRLQRRTSDQPVERFRAKKVKPYADDLRGALASFAERSVKTLSQLEPVCPTDLSDRQTDVWEPLIAVADLCGGDWPTRSRRAAVELSKSADKALPLSVSQRLLQDLRDGTGTDAKLRPEALAQTLNNDGWAGYRGRGISARDIGAMLASYEVHSRTLRDGSETYRGYTRAEIEAACERYLPRTVTQDRAS